MNTRNKWISDRAVEWELFSVEVSDHVENYTVPQYGDKGEDNCTEFTEADFITQIKKYANRMGRNIREGQEQLDLLKIAHYCAMLWTKREETKDIPDNTIGDLTNGN